MSEDLRIFYLVLFFIWMLGTLGFFGVSLARGDEWSGPDLNVIFYWFCFTVVIAAVVAVPMVCTALRWIFNKTTSWAWENVWLVGCISVAVCFFYLKKSTARKKNLAEKDALIAKLEARVKSLSDYAYDPE